MGGVRGRRGSGRRAAMMRTRGCIFSIGRRASSGDREGEREREVCWGWGGVGGDRGVSRGIDCRGLLEMGR